MWWCGALQVLIKYMFYKILFNGRYNLKKKWYKSRWLASLKLGIWARCLAESSPVNTKLTKVNLGHPYGVHTCFIWCVMVDPQVQVQVHGQVKVICNMIQSYTKVCKRILKYKNLSNVCNTTQKYIKETKVCKSIDIKCLKSCKTMLSSANDSKTMKSM